MKLPIVWVSETWLDDCFHFSGIICGLQIFCINLESVALVLVFTLRLCEHFNYKERPDLAFQAVQGSAGSLFVEIWSKSLPYKQIKSLNMPSTLTHP